MSGDWRDIHADQNLRLAQKMLEQQGEINALKAERDDLRARLANALHHAHRLTGRIAIGTEPWNVLTALLAALEAPAQATTEEKADG